MPESRPTRASLLRQLAEPSLDANDDALDADLQRAQLRRSVLVIAAFDHTSTITMVLDLVARSNTAGGDGS